MLSNVGWRQFWLPMSSDIAGSWVGTKLAPLRDSAPCDAN
jgi:hypothetical protein